MVYSAIDSICHIICFFLFFGRFIEFSIIIDQSKRFENVMIRFDFQKTLVCTWLLDQSMIQGFLLITDLYLTIFC